MPAVALYQPEIPPNTGNIIRLCANTAVDLHLIHPLGFSVDDKQVKRAGLDYHELTRIHHHNNYQAFTHSLQNNPRLLACSTRGKKIHTDIQYQPTDILLFGPETQGLPQTLLAELPEDQIIRIPMQPGSRSLNLSNAVAVILYEALRQMGFNGLK
ncbi:MAG TPA: tRNA (uridine(34)/cytosine(34)/5-carboxymethylaminomethyluridine(34)-2'-O)-methyltransferase TrmL [Gammaproteobacteria bacterium]|nr:tRNA (uridine(34)/cytosine(34)/5-carboxymethylaminomethyluridine(34)-2'-O)-methyltransferase TrmL [Gammaproteobacteria bacterium]